MKIRTLLAIVMTYNGIKHFRNKAPKKVVDFLACAPKRLNEGDEATYPTHVLFVWEEQDNLDYKDANRLMKWIKETVPIKEWTSRYINKEDVQVGGFLQEDPFELHTYANLVYKEE